MLRQLILIVIISITAGCAQADPNLIHHIENAQIVNYSVDYLHDKNNNINFNEVIKAQFSSLSKRHSFGTHYEVIWYRITVTNLSKTDIHQYLHENLAYYSKEIELYESLDSNRFSEKKYNLWDSNVGSKLTGSTLVYPLDIKAESEKIIYIKKVRILKSNKMIIHFVFQIGIIEKIITIFQSQNHFCPKSNFMIT